MYERYCDIRDSKGLKDSDVAKATKIPKSTFSDWKNGRSVPKIQKLKLIADFLEIKIEHLLGSDSISWNPEEQEIVEDYYLNENTREYAKFLFSNPEYKVLFDASRKVKPEDLQKALKAIGLFIEE